MATGNEKKFELKIGKSGLITVLLGMTALLFAAFLFGIDVGQNMDTYPDKIASLPQKALALVWRPARIRMAKQPESLSHAGPSEAEDNIDLTYHETLMSKKGLNGAHSFEGKPPVANQAPPTDVSPAGNAGNVPVESPAQHIIVTDDQRPKETANVAAKDVVKDQEKPQEKETVKPKALSGKTGDPHNASSGQEKYFIQVASLKDKSAAYAMNKTIDSLGFHSKIIKIDVKGKGILYRVVASDFPDKDKATEAAKKISSKTGTTCMIKKVDAATNKN